MNCRNDSAVSNWRKACLAAFFVAGGLISQPPIAQAQTISFQQVLNAPDDPQLNLDYARQEVVSGRLQQAAAALERLILTRPNWDEARLFYGIVLYRMDDLDGAIRELQLLENRGLTPSQERDRVRYLALANKKSDPVRFTARFSLGTRWDSNPGRVADVVAAAVGFPSQDSDLALSGSSQFRLESDIQGAQGSYLFFQVNGNANEFFDVDRADFGAARAKAGATFLGPGLEISTYAIYGISQLQRETFQHHYGFAVDTRWGLSSNVELLLNGRGIYENYRVTSYSPVGDRRDGWRTSVEGGFKFRPADWQTFTLTGGYANKSATSAGFSYDEARIDLKSLTLFDGGRYLSLSGTFKNTQYDAIDNFYTITVPRDDDFWRVRAAAGAPLETLFRGFGLPDSVADIVAQVGVSYSRQDSNIPYLDLDNWSTDLIFTKRIAF